MLYYEAPLMSMLFTTTGFDPANRTEMHGSAAKYTKYTQHELLVLLI